MTYRVLITVDVLRDRKPNPWDCTRVIDRGKEIVAGIGIFFANSRYLAIKRVGETNSFRAQAQFFVTVPIAVDCGALERLPMNDVRIQAELFPEALIEEAAGLLESGVIDHHLRWTAREQRAARGRRKWTSRSGRDRKARTRRRSSGGARRAS